MKGVNVNMFRNKQSLMPELLLFVLMSAVSANGILDLVAISGSMVELPCSLPAPNQSVTWKRRNNYGEIWTIAICNAECVPESEYKFIYKVTINETSSTLLISLNEPGQHQFLCFFKNDAQQTYNVTFIEQSVISPPNCSIIPTTSHQGRDATLTFSCESHVPHELPSVLTMLGFSESISTSGKSGDLHVVNGIDLMNFRENLNVVCELRIFNVNIRCSFPQSTKVAYTPDVKDAVFDCYVDPGDVVTWRLLDSEGREEDMAGRSWTRDGERSLLIRNITEQDIGKVAECRINGSVGFGVIARMEPSKNDGHNGSTQTYGSHRDRSVYVILTFVFGGLLLLTLLIVISHWRCGACAHPMKWYAQFKPHGKPKASTTNQLSGSIENSFSERGTNSRGPGGDEVTIRESNLNSDNQNNSALKHPRDPTPPMKATSSSDAGASSSVHPGQPVVDTNQHTYFCVERSTPPPSLPDLSTSESMTIYQDPDYEESQRQRLRDSAGYDVVDASKKKVNNNFDMDDYAEVGGAYDMTSNPAIAPRSSKGLTGERIVMSSDPAVLYGKVNK